MLISMIWNQKNLTQIKLKTKVMRDDFYMNAKIRCKFGTNDTNGATQLCGHVFHVDIPRYSSNDIFKLLVASVHHKKEHDEHRDKVYAYFQRLREIIQHYNQHTTMTLGIGICILSFLCSIGI